MALHPDYYEQWHPDAQDWHGYSDDDVDAAIFGIRNRTHGISNQSVESESTAIMTWYPTIECILFSPAHAKDTRPADIRKLARTPHPLHYAHTDRAYAYEKECDRACIGSAMQVCKPYYFGTYRSPLDVEHARREYNLSMRRD